MIENCPVTAIEPMVFERMAGNLVVGADLTEIQNSTFVNTSLGKIEFTGEVDTVKAGAFAYGNLQEIRFTKVGTIEQSAFNDCPALIEVNCYEAHDIQDGAFVNCPNLAYVPLGDEQLGIDTSGYAQDECRLAGFSTTYANSNSRVGFPSVIEGRTVIDIAATGFKNNSTLEYVYLGDSVKTIGRGAFENCTNLKEIWMPGVTTIEEEAFRGCSSLNVSLSDKVTSIGRVAFDGVTAEKCPTIFVPMNATVGDSIFGSSYTGTVSAVTGSPFVAAYAGTSDYTITITDNAPRMVAMTGGTTFAGQYNTYALKEVQGSLLKFSIEGDTSGASIDYGVLSVADGQTSVSESDILTGYTSVTTYNGGEVSVPLSGRSVVVVRIIKNGTSQYITSNIVVPMTN